MFTFTFIILVLLLPHSSFTSIIALPSSDVVHASSGLILHYLNTYSPSNRIISFTVSIPMTIDTCYLIPLNAIQKIPRCHRSSFNSSGRSSFHNKRFPTDIISIGIGSAAPGLTATNTIQVNDLRNEVKTLINSLSMLINTANTHTTQLFHHNEGQLKLARELNNTQMALNRTIDLVNEYSDVLERHSDAIISLASFAQLLNNNLTTFIHSVETHFLHTSLSDILANRLNLHFIHDTDLPAVLDFIITSSKVSFNPDATDLPLVDLVSRLLIQQRIDFIPNTIAPTSRDHLIGILSISSFFAATTRNETSFSLYQLLPIPFPYGGQLVRLADTPFIIGLDAITNHLIRWTQHESTNCDFRVMSVCRETPPIITNWKKTCLFQILTDTILSACRTEEYLEPIFIHRIGKYWAISTNATHQCHSTSVTAIGQSYLVNNNTRILSPVALITIAPNTTLICDGFSIFSHEPVITGSSLTILDSSILNTYYTDVFDLYLPLSNTTRWPKLPYIPDHFQAILGFIANRPTPAPLHPLIKLYRSPLSYFNIIIILIIIGFVGVLLYRHFVRQPTSPAIPLVLARIT